MSDASPLVSFHDQHSAPRIGLGTWRVENDVATAIVREGIASGYRHIDTAAMYHNEAGVGAGLAASGVARKDLFVATKVWHDQLGHEATRAALHASLQALQLDYLDLYLIHWPAPKQNQYVQAWEALIQLRDEGLVKSIGVCNFPIVHLQRLLDKTGVLPVVNQVELHPHWQQHALRAFHAQHGIVTEAWSPLGQGTLLGEPVLHSIAHKHGRTPAQVVLRWHVQMGHMVIPKTVTPARLTENLNVFGFLLDAEDMAAIAALDRASGRIGPDPEDFPA